MPNCAHAKRTIIMLLFLFFFFRWSLFEGWEGLLSQTNRETCRQRVLPPVFWSSRVVAKCSSHKQHYQLVEVLNRVSDPSSIPFSWSVRFNSSFSSRILRHTCASVPFSLSLASPLSTVSRTLGHARRSVPFQTHTPALWQKPTGQNWRQTNKLIENLMLKFFP